MELALLLVVIVIVELVFTVWFLARQKGYKAQVEALTGEVQALEHDVSILGENVFMDAKTLRGVAADSAKKDETQTLQNLVSQATPEDLLKAQELLKSMGFGD